MGLFFLSRRTELESAQPILSSQGRCATGTSSQTCSHSSANDKALLCEARGSARSILGTTTPWQFYRKVVKRPKICHNRDNRKRLMAERVFPFSLKAGRPAGTELQPIVATSFQCFPYISSFQCSSVPLKRIRRETVTECTGTFPVHFFYAPPANKEDRVSRDKLTL